MANKKVYKPNPNCNYSWCDVNKCEWKRNEECETIMLAGSQGVVQIEISTGGEATIHLGLKPLTVHQ